MGATNKKTAKGRLDKYYHLAKEQGYRARSAFKLIQLNKKYHFLENSRVVVDLCAAPGGWLQVASKYMPMSKLIIGVDLVPIKPIPGVITLTSDITSDACRSQIKREVKDWKVDVVLHDGAPNVGSAWVQDAYSQSELVLQALKLATEFLKPGGLFISKVFRSKDYNALVWVFSQLFRKVDATKPASSRSVSAEIFVVCHDYLAPSKIDPKFLDPKFVFKDDVLSLKPLDIFHPEKRIRQREGYEEGSTSLYKIGTLGEFLTTKDPAAFLGSYYKLEINDKRYEEAAQTTEDIKIYCQDLKLLGRREFKALLKWRLSLLAQFPCEKEGSLEKDEHAPQVEAVELSDTEILDALITSGSKKARKEKKKSLLKKAKERERMKLGMHFGACADETSAYSQDHELFGSKDGSLVHIEDDMHVASDADEDGPEMRYKEDACQDEDQMLSEGDSDADLDQQIEDMYAKYQDRVNLRSARDLAIHASEQADIRAAIEENAPRGKSLFDAAQDSSDLEQESDPGVDEMEHAQEKNSLEVSLLNEEESKREKIKRASLLFSRPIFQNFDNDDSKAAASTFATQQSFGASEDEEEGLAVGEIKDMKNKRGDKRRKLMDADPSAESASSIEPVASGKFAKENRKKEQALKSKGKKRSRSAKEKDVDENGAKSREQQGDIIFVKSDAVPEPGEEEEEDAFEDGWVAEECEPFSDADQLKLLSPEALTLALKLRASKNARKEMIEASFNRYAFEDADTLPSWFRDDENQHNKPSISITKEAVALLKEKLKTLQNKPIKKVIEAKLRLKSKLIKSIEAAKNKSSLINENEELSEGQKSSQIAKLMGKTKSKKASKKKVTVCVGRKGSVASKGKNSRPSGVKGRYKMVDKRMKKEVRATKRIQKKNRKGGGRRK